MHLWILRQSEVQHQTCCLVVVWSLESLDFQKPVMEEDWNDNIVDAKVNGWLDEQIDEDFEWVLEEDVGEETYEVHYEVAIHSVV